MLSDAQGGIGSRAPNLCGWCCCVVVVLVRLFASRFRVSWSTYKAPPRTSDTVLDTSQRTVFFTMHLLKILTEQRVLITTLAVREATRSVKRKLCFIALVVPS